MFITKFRMLATKIYFNLLRYKINSIVSTSFENAPFDNHSLFGI